MANPVPPAAIDREIGRLREQNAQDNDASYDEVGNSLTNAEFSILDNSNLPVSLNATIVTLTNLIRDMQREKQTMNKRIREIEMQIGNRQVTNTDRDIQMK